MLAFIGEHSKPTLMTYGTGKSRNKQRFKVEWSWRSCACAPSVAVLADKKGSESPLPEFSCRLMLQLGKWGEGGGGGGSVTFNELHQVYVQLWSSCQYTTYGGVASS